MNTARRIPHSLKEGTYLTVHEGLMVRIDRTSVFSYSQYFPDWLLYTDLTSAANGGTGLMKLVSEIKLSWVEDYMPRLKEINVK